MGKGDMGTKLGTPSPHKQKGTGTAEGEEHGMGTQLAFWPQALGSTSNLEGNGAWPHAQTALNPNKCSQGLKFSFDSKF